MIDDVQLLPLLVPSGPELAAVDVGADGVGTVPAPSEPTLHPDANLRPRQVRAELAFLHL